MPRGAKALTDGGWAVVGPRQVKALLSLNAKVNAVDKDGRSPLWGAADKGHLEALQVRGLLTCLPAV